MIVVNLGNPDHAEMIAAAQAEGRFVYIGRAAPRRRLRASKWHNPFRIGPGGDRGDVLAKFEAYVCTRPDLLEDLHEFCGKVLGCWCAPKPCHGDVLARLATTYQRAPARAPCW